MLSRFCSADYREHGIVGIKVRRIIRVHNRILRSRFDEKLLSIVDEADGEYYATGRSVLLLSSHLSRYVRKPVFGVSDQVLHKQGCTATEDG